MKIIIAGGRDYQLDESVYSDLEVQQTRLKQLQPLQDWTGLKQTC